MKKQIFILVLLVMAIFANVSKSYGQLAPRAVTCLTADALHPIAGTPYDYSITVPTPAGTKAYTWFVTQDKNFIAAGTLTANRELSDGSGNHVLTTGVGYNDPATGLATISITWKSYTYDAANPVFVVIQATNDNGTGCTTQNMKVYKIQPQNAFTLDLDNLTAAGANHTPLVYGDNYDVCMSNIASATYDANAPEGLIYDFGTNTFLYEVVAANWSTAWNPSVQLTGIDAEETVTVQWSKDVTFASGVTTMTGSAIGTGATPTVYTSAANVTATNAGGTVGTAGESIYIRVTLDHSVGALNYEGLAVEPFTLAVDGITVPGGTNTPEKDIHFEAGTNLPAEACPWDDNYTNDRALQTLLPRPTINAAGMPAPGLLPVKP